MLIPRKDHIPYLRIDESFKNEQSLLENGFTITGNPIINNGISGFTTANYVSKFMGLGSSDFTISMDVTINSFTDSVRIIGSDDTGSNWLCRTIVTGNNLLFYCRIGLINNAFSNPIDISKYIGKKICFGISIEFTGTNTEISVYINGKLGSSPASYLGRIGHLNGIDLGIWKFSSQAFDGTIHNFQFFYGKAFGEEDHSLLCEKDISYSLPASSRLYIPGKVDYNDGTNQVTPVEGTVISTAIQGDGVTPGTFPIFLDDGWLQYGSNRFLDLGDDDDFSFSNSDPFSVGAYIYLDTTQPDTYSPIISKVAGFGAAGGEYMLYYEHTDNSIRFIIIDNDDGGLRLFYKVSALIPGKFYTVVATYSGSGTFDTTSVKIYVNGVDVGATLFSSGTFTALRNTTKPVYVGRRVETSFYFDGNIKYPFVVGEDLGLFDVFEWDKEIRVWNDEARSIHGDLQPHKNGFILSGDDSYDDGSNQITSVVGTITDKFIMGDGSSINTFPVLDGDRIFDFDGDAYMFDSDKDDYTVLLNEPLSLGALISIHPNAFSSFAIISKLVSIAAGGGEWLFYRNKSDISLRFLFLDNVDGGYKLIYAPNTLYDNKLNTVFMTYDGSGVFSTDTWKLFVNGKEVSATIITSGTFNNIYNTDKGVYIGAFSGPSVIALGKIGLPLFRKIRYSPLQIEILHEFLLHSWRMQ
jgi:hypothetical protein